MTAVAAGETPPATIVLYPMICPTNPAVPIPEPMALLVIFNTIVETGPNTALVRIGGIQISGFLTMFGT